MVTCRLCLYEGDENQVMPLWENQVENLAEKIKDCVSINIRRNDNVTTSICVSCVHLVTQWENFKVTSQKSNEILLRAAKEISENEEFSYIESNNDKRKVRKSKRKATRRRYKPSDDDSSSEQDFKDDVNYLDKEFCDLEFKVELPENTYTCGICLQNYNNCFDYLDHQESHDGAPVFQCDKCPEGFEYRQHLIEHDKNHRTACLQCGKMILKSSMKLHLIKHTDKYKCTQCFGRFNSKAALSQHVITVHTDIKDHICETCGKRFSSQTAMRVHMKSHSDERLYPCRLCSYAGRTASAIYVHMSTHASDLCVCEVCSKIFKSNRNLNDHLRRVHSKVKRHECTYCDKKFVDKYMLKVHLRCHTGVRPYLCTLCEKAFIRSDGLKEHMVTHGQRTIYDCRDCGKKFTSKRGVARHSCAAVI